jgi:DNA-binding transcriptional LysR family regulator
MNFGLYFIVNEITNPLLFEMIRSFSKLAKTLNLSHAVHELSSTRQTVRRHIASLEEIKGENLFEVVN